MACIQKSFYYILSRYLYLVTPELPHSPSVLSEDPAQVPGLVPCSEAPPQGSPLSCGVIAALENWR